MNIECKFKTVDHFTIAGTHTISGGKGVVLWLHGITVNRDEYMGFFKDGAQFLSSFGIDSLRIDFRGHGNSSGSSLDFSIVGQMMDLEAALRYLVKYYKKGLNLFIVGCSFGAPPALFAAQRFASIINGIVLIAPVLSYERTFLKPETDWAKSLFNKKSLARLNQTNKLFINRTFPISSQIVEEMKIVKPELALQGLKMQVLLIHGDADSMVPFQASKDLAKDNLNIKLVPFRRMEHGFMDVKDEGGKGISSLKNKQRIYELIREQFI
jgi:pimeloyl-ACP methyl ester carboxylesterase